MQLSFAQNFSLWQKVSTRELNIKENTPFSSWFYLSEHRSNPSYGNPLQEYMFLSEWKDMYTTSVQPESNFRCLKLIHLKMNSHNRKFTTLFLKIDQVHTICIADEKRRNVNLMPMTIIFHHNSRIRSFVMVVNDYKVCSQILSINDFFCKFATTSLNQHYFLNIRIFVSYSLFCSYIT